MRLIDTVTFEIQEFYGDEIPQYAILSHTWGAGEVTLQDMQRVSMARKDGSPAQAIECKPGYTKILLFCDLASKEGYSWAWVDTCCIDKTSSAELSEAINSMYQWYAKSEICYVFLADFSSSLPETVSLAASRWFTRGWTLQELLAPLRVEFYDSSWLRIGRLDERYILEQIASITGIPRKCLRREKQLASFSVAAKMSGASNRHCTRVEDIAYSLMGIFEVNMPLLYGEGEKAFTRLQEEILKETDDHSIFAWTVPVSDPRSFAPADLFARSPIDFSQSGHLLALYSEQVPSTVTKLGLSIRLPMNPTPVDYPCSSHLGQGYLTQPLQVYRAALNCGLDYDESVIILLIPVERFHRPGDVPQKFYYRLGIASLEYGTITPTYSDIYIAKRASRSSDYPFGNGGIHLQNIPHSEASFFKDHTSRDKTHLHGDFVVSTIHMGTEFKIRPLKSYACFLFTQKDLGEYNAPLKIQFVSPQHADNIGESFHVDIWYSDEHVYLDIQLGKVSGTNERARQRISRHLEMIATLQRESPSSQELCTAGNRRHFVLLVESRVQRLEIE